MGPKSHRHELSSRSLGSLRRAMRHTLISAAGSKTKTPCSVQLLIIIGLGAPRTCSDYFVITCVLANWNRGVFTSRKLKKQEAGSITPTPL